MLLNSIIVVIFLVVFVEAVTEIVTTSAIFLGVRNFFAKRNENGFFTKLTSCGYCFSVWVSAYVAWYVPGCIAQREWINHDVATVLDYILFLFIIHRLSNIWHAVISRYLKGLPLFGPYVEVEEDELEG